MATLENLAFTSAVGVVILDLTISGGMGGLEALKWTRAVDSHVRAAVLGYSG